MSTARTHIIVGDMVRLKGDKREGRVVAITDGIATVVYPDFDEEGIPVGPGERLSLPLEEFERPGLARGDLVYTRRLDTNGVVVYQRGTNVKVRIRGIDYDLERDDLTRINHYSREEAHTA